MNFKIPFSLNYKNGFIVLAIIVGVLMPFLSYNYGVHEDSRYHQEHGERLLDFYKGISNVAAQSPLNDEGNLVDVNKSLNHEHRGMNGFGGFFDLLTNFLHQFFPSVGVYEFRNIINGLFGFLLFLFCGLLGKELGSWKTGILSFILVVLTPVLFGHSMSNPKDIPFAAFYIFSIYHIIKLYKEFPKISLKRAFLLIINISLLINVRLIGLVIFGHLFFSFFLWWVVENYAVKYENINIKETMVLCFKILTIAILGYVTTAIFWPYIQTKPITGLIELFLKVKDFKGFENIQLFEGKWLRSYNMPWYYMIKVLLFITIPLAVLISFVFIPFYYKNKSKKQVVLFSLLLFTSLFPLLLLTLGKPNSYDNARQFLFIVPPIIVAGALALSNFYEGISSVLYKRIALMILAILLIEPSMFIAKNKQLSPLYFSPMVGGTEGAFKKYEIDYWGIAVKPAVDWLDKNVGSKEKPARVRLFYGDQLKLSYYTKKIPNITYVAAAEISANWDYSIVMLAEAKHKRSLLNNWPPKNTIHEVKVDGLIICAVVKNVYSSESEIIELQKKLKSSPSVSGFIQLGLLHYKKKEYIKSIIANRNAVILDSKNSVAYNNMCVVYNLLKMYSKAEEACSNSLKYSNSDLAKNNLKMAKGELAKKEQFSADQYLALSVNYYLLNYYEDCIKSSESLLAIDPKNSIAYNNICASYNGLEDYKKAEIACDKAIKLNPDFQLAKNNLEVSLKGLNKN